MATITKPIALDETLQAVNETLGEIKEAILPSNTYIPKVASPTAGNLASLKADGTIEDSGLAKTDVVHLSNEALDIKMLGWSVPKECPVQNYMDSNRVFHQRVVRYIFKGTETVVAFGSSYPHLFCVSANFGQKKAEESQLYLNGYIPYSDVSSYDVNVVYIFANGDVAINNVSCSTAEELKQAIVGKCIYVVAENEVTIPVDGSETTNIVNNITPEEYSPTRSTAYTVGELCKHEGKLYQCNTVTSGTWNPAYWNKVILGNMATLSYTVVSTF